MMVTIMITVMTDMINTTFIGDDGYDYDYGHDGYGR